MNPKPNGPDSAASASGGPTRVEPPTFVWPPRHSLVRGRAPAWGIWLVLIPLAGLAGFGLFSLRQDRLLVEQEARERAEQLAAGLAERMYASLTAPADTARGDVAFVIEPNGRLVRPPALAGLAPDDPLQTDELTPAQRQLWIAAERGEFATERPGTNSAAWRQVAEASPPARWESAARYNLAVALAREGNQIEAERQWRELTAAPATAVTGSGTPLRTLAEWRLLDAHLQRPDGHDEALRLFTSLGSNLVQRPSILSATLLQQLQARAAKESDSVRDSVAAFGRQWDQDERARNVHQAALKSWLASLPDDPDAGRGELPTNGWMRLPRRIWVHGPGSSTGTNWLVQAVIPGLPISCVSRTESRVRELAASVAQTPQFPPYFTVRFEIAGQPLDPTRLPLLATADAAGSQSPGRSPWVRASVHLADPAALYARQRRRSLWLGGLVVAAAGLAIGGLAAAHRALDRQVRLNEMKGNFVSSVSHELRAPIASVRLLAEGLDRGTVTDEGRRQTYYRLIVQECRRLSALIENVLDFSRIDQGRKQYAFEPTDLPALLTQTVNLMAPYAAEREVRLLLAPPSTELQNTPVRVDGKAIQQAVINLIDNAIKHAPPRSDVEVALVLASDLGEFPTPPGAPAPPHPCCLLRVTDAGPGVPFPERERIFEPFYRRGSELRRETPGIGIGLSIVKHIVDAHAGRVWVENAPGQGSRFVMALPLDASSPGLTQSTPTS